VDLPRLANVLRLDAEYSRAAPLPSGRPLEAYVEVSARCNLRCPMCAITADPRYAPTSKRPALLTPELFDRLEPFFSTLVRVHLFGLGEPVLNPHLPEWVERLAGRGVEVWVTTNATLVDDLKAESLARAGLARVTVSIDGATKETYERFRPPARFEHVVRGIRALGAARRRFGKPRLFLSMVGMASNLAELPQLVDLCSEVGGDGVYLEELYGWPDPAIERLYERERLGRLPERQVRDVLSETARRARAANLDWACRLDERSAWGIPGVAAPRDAPAGDGPGMPWVCSEPWTTVSVNASGEVKTCCYNDTILGHVAGAPVEAIWHGPGYVRLREDMAAGRTPEGCRLCVVSGRVKRSPFFFPGQAVDKLPPAAHGARVETPADGAIVTDSLILAGTRGAALPGAWRHRLPDVFIGKTLVAQLRNCPLTKGRRFADVIPIPYVTAGKHILSLRWPGRSGEPPRWERREIQVAKVPAEDGTIVGTKRAAVAVPLNGNHEAPRLRVDGRTVPMESWAFGRTPAGWLGVGTFDIAALTPGRHECELSWRKERPVRRPLWRLAAQ
jgi:MoaA/NifB/PqqE/SkfB family radical SAM enzyme